MDTKIIKKVRRKTTKELNQNERARVITWSLSEKKLFEILNMGYEHWFSLPSKFAKEEKKKNRKSHVRNVLMLKQCLKAPLSGP